MSPAPAYCEPADVQEAMQEVDEKFGQTAGPLESDNVEAAIIGVSRWLRTVADGHWYDSTAAASDLISASPATTTNRTLDVSSSPHRQRGQHFRSGHGRGQRDVVYPNTVAGPYVKVRLPVRYVESVDRLAVRQPDGEVEDWVADAEITQGRGEDYYLASEGDAVRRDYLYLHAGSIGPRTHFENLLEVDLTYGRDYDTNPWDDVRRGVAHIAAAELVVDDDVITALPNDGALINVETEAQQHANAAIDRYLAPYMEVPVA